jgi:pimeloyl-ACP methyl ester carboxylesterase
MSLALQADESYQLKVEELLAAQGRQAPEFWQPGVCRELYVPVPEAEIRVFHSRPASAPDRRPIVLIPGWGTIPQGFQSFYEVIHGRAELFYLETREKNSSRILGRRPDLSVLRSARDIQAALEALGLAGGDFVLMGTCWGAAMILEGLIEGVLEAPTILLTDPMHTLWFSKWVLRWISPILPSFAVRLIRPLLRQALLGDMEDTVQKERTFAFVNSADIWKWKRSAEAARDFELYGRLSAVKRELFVINGTADKVHDQRHYPRIARELPEGRFLYLPVDESRRERMFAAVAMAFASVSCGDGLPPCLSCFERPVRKGSSGSSTSAADRRGAE